MQFYEKLDFLMNITKTTNSTLAMYTSLDASHISRLRRGERRLVKEADYLKKMAHYFISHCIEDYQIKTLSQIIKMQPEHFQDSKKATEVIYQWLIGHEETGHASISGFLDGISDFQFRKNTPVSDEFTDSDSKIPKKDVALYYGIEGKREAVLSFLSLILEADKPTTLLLYSDESMDWLTGDPSFAAKWRDLLARVILKGNRIKVIHTVSRNLDEMLEALSKWMPLYMTGAIEPYYYPKKRDGVFKRTLFIAPKITAITTSSLDMMTHQALNILFKDKKALAALTSEFESYLFMCRPLMQIFTYHQKQQYLDLLKEFEKDATPTLLKSNCLNWSTMPSTVAESIINRSDSDDKEKLIQYYYDRKEAFEKGLEHCSFHALLQLPSVTDVREGVVNVAFTGIPETSNICYTPFEYKAHLENTIQYLQKYDNYNIKITTKNRHDSFILYVKEDLGAIVIKQNTPHAIFAINEINMTAAFWDYLKDEINLSEKDKTSTLKDLNDLYNRL
ncbi:MAG: transcriptional regulator [Vallitaleaceae bacterium]|nr:transcriptional regulator [Vallitaleaceae bacterium]